MADSRCTWEPPENFENTNLMRDWAARRLNMGDEAFQEMVAKTHRKWVNAKSKADRNKEKRRQKRAKREKRKLSRMKKPVSPPQAESDDDTPLILKRRLPVAPATKSREESADVSSLFVSGNPEPTGANRVARRLPLDQSSEDEDLSDRQSVTSVDSLMEDIRKNEGKQQTKEGKLKRRSLQSKNVGNRKTTQGETEKVQRKVPEATAPVLGSKENDKSKPSARAPPTAAANLVARKAVLDPPARAKRSSAAAGITPPAPKPPIKMVNQPKTARKEWKNSAKHYSTLHYRGTADKRSRIEATPDPTRLEFVNGDPVGILPHQPSVSRPWLAADNIYGRRESGLRQQVDVGDEPPARTNAELQPYERGKIPMTCFDWRSGTCKFTAPVCRFMHREKDPDGKAYRISPWDGKIPGKYKNPPETCLYWLRNEHGCNSSADDCMFAHENTGLLPSIFGKPPEKIDRDEKPREMTLPKHRTPPVTCWYWMNGSSGCTKSAEGCKYAHENTGYLAGRGGQEWKLIDKSTLPVFQKPQRRPSSTAGALTCFFWNHGTCKNTEESCPYLHRYTGKVADPPRLWRFPDGSHTQVLRGAPSLNPHAQEPPVYLPERLRLEASPQLDEDMMDAPSFIEPPKEEQPKMTPEAASIKAIVERIETVLHLNFNEMFSYNDQEDGTLDKRAFLLFHPGIHAKELDMITRWLLVNEVEAFNFWSEGSWEEFRKETCNGKTGIIIAPEEYELYPEIPGLAEVLRTKVRLWSIGNQEESENDSSMSISSPKVHYDRAEIFPHGGIIHMTDDVFVKKPQLALKIIELFLAKIEACRQVTGPADPDKYVNDGCLLWRLAVRPEFMKTVYDTVEEQSAYYSATHPDQQARIKIYEILSTTGYIEQDDLDNADINDPYFVHPVRPDDYFPIISERRDIMEEMYYASPSSDQPVPFANTKMVEYFGGMLNSLRKEYRHYFVVHTEPNSVVARDWKKRIAVVDEVLSPEQCVREFEGPAKGNRFEFYEWAFPAKRRADNAMV
ncbi:hypothetical protein P280DRAFT_507175 [Massarina eburnea CBS 473.64]|uniref:C3H1-type domain-containing protein n=1 Tax=Massarina eburnea CBS 473.64 TaxID=1395130 RepID=A0A6A6S232_9PLEO|nr:hypothetical protein P280DRAFT_507175 [Massarina eburnea CBS 473.64]